ncbi:alpha/beta hydrolase [Candidatus Gracilibacteria bacterium]|nr:alpha/beta hydrolase [Candidatus Gracilibacteria bacterium]
MLPTHATTERVPVAHSCPPTAKYLTYLAEVGRALQGKLNARERKRLEGERALLERARFVRVNGLIQHYLDAGPRDGPTLLLIHGWDCSAYWWHHIIDPLAAAGYRVIAADLRGHGFSENDAQANYTVAAFSSDLAALADALGLKRFHLAAFSLGAFVGLHYAVAQPQRVRSLLFFNFALLQHNAAAERVVPGLLGFMFNRVLRPIERRNLWWIPFLYTRLVMAQHTPPVSDVRLGTLGLRFCDPAAVRVSTTELVKRATLDAVPQQAQALQVPLLLVAGKQDPLMPPQGGRALAELVPQGRYLEVPKCGHLILFELPARVVLIMKDFLADSGRNNVPKEQEHTPMRPSYSGRSLFFCSLVLLFISRTTYATTSSLRRADRQRAYGSGRRSDGDGRGA